MSVKHYCDLCEAEITPDNRASRRHEFKATSEQTGVEFNFEVTHSSNAGMASGRITQNNGDLCEDCLITAMGAHLENWLAEKQADVTNNLGLDDEDDYIVREPGADEVEENLGYDSTLEEEVTEQDELEDDEYSEDETDL